uniref:Holin n=1 Tax=viral metagenome TaxID=1070528 RepID=A0A6M3KAG9_9ZZZZ
MFTTIYNSIFKNWLTSVLGGIPGGALILAGFAANPDDWNLIIAGIGAFIAGLVQKDSNVTGGTTKQ